MNKMEFVHGVMEVLTTFENTKPQIAVAEAMSFINELLYMKEKFENTEHTTNWIVLDDEYILLHQLKLTEEQVRLLKFLNNHDLLCESLHFEEVENKNFTQI